MTFLAFGLIQLMTICWVSAQDGTLTRVYCENSPCEGERFHMSFQFSGTVPPTASSSIGFYKSGITIPLCEVDRTAPCSPITTTIPCNCTESGGKRIYHLFFTSANTTEHNGDWTAVLVAGVSAETVRSPVCQIQVNTSCPTLATDACPATVNKDEPLYISFVQRKSFPSTAGSVLTIMNEGTKTVQATINFALGVQTLLPAGSFERDGRRVYYLNLTGACEVHAGSWIASVADGTGTIRSEACRVAVGDPKAHHTGRTLVILLAVFCAVVVLMFILSFVITKMVELLFRIMCIVSLLFGVIPAAEINLQVQDIIPKYYPELHQATIAFVVIGVLIMVAAIVVTIVFFVKKPPTPIQANGNTPKPDGPQA